MKAMAGYGLILVLAGWGVGLEWGQAEAPRPNVVLVLVDDMGFSDLGCYGGEIDTPHLDALAADGLRFTQFYNTGRCWPTRISLLTGKYPHEAGHAMQYGPGAPRAYAGHTPDQGRFLSEALHDAGYRCYHVGKWHMDNGRVKEQPNPTWPLQRGFDRSLWVRTQHNFFNPWRLLDEDRPVERPAGEDSILGNGEYYLTTAFTDRAIRYLQEHEAEHAGKPFFLYLAHTAPHFPLHALPEDIERFRDGRYAAGWEAIRQARWERLREMGIVDAPLSPPDELALNWDRLSEEERDGWETRMAIHAAMVYRIDAGIGRLVEQLRAMDAYEDTLILFLSDNGASAEFLVRGDGHDPEAPPGSGASYLCLEVSWANASNSPFRQHKMWMHEGGIATPLIAHWPAGVPARGGLTEQMGHVIDLAPTVADLAGATMEGTTGHTLQPVLAGGTRPEPEFLFWEHVGHRALRQGNWKLVAEHGKDWELYDLSTDRTETNDLATSRPERVERMIREWQAYANSIGVVSWDSLPQSRRKPGPDYRTK